MFTDKTILLRCQYFPNWSTDLIYSLLKSQLTSLEKLDKLILKFIWKQRKSRIAKTILKRKSKVGELTLPNFKTYCQVTVIKTLWFWLKYRHIDQWSATETAEIDACIYCQLFFNKDANPIRWGKNNFVSTNGIRTAGFPHAKQLSWTLLSHHLQKLTQWIKDLETFIVLRA